MKARYRISIHHEWEEGTLLQFVSGDRGAYAVIRVKGNEKGWSRLVEVNIDYVEVKV